MTTCSERQAFADAVDSATSLAVCVFSTYTPRWQQHPCLVKFVGGPSESFVMCPLAKSERKERGTPALVIYFSTNKAQFVMLNKSRMCFERLTQKVILPLVSLAST